MILIKGNVERLATEEALITKLEGEGFQAVGAVTKKEPKASGKPVTGMKVDELKALAKEKGVEGANSLTKEELLAVLKDVKEHD